MGSAEVEWECSNEYRLGVGEGVMPISGVEVGVKGVTPASAAAIGGVRRVVLELRAIAGGINGEMLRRLVTILGEEIGVGVGEKGIFILASSSSSTPVMRIEAGAMVVLSSKLSIT